MDSKFLQVNLSSAYTVSEYKMVSSSDRPSRSPLPMVPEIVPIVERLTGEELEEISPLVLWPNFDEDNIESFCKAGLVHGVRKRTSVYLGCCMCVCGRRGGDS